MTMHIVGPWLSTSGKRRGKQKFRSAEEARRARELEQSWNDLKTKWGVPEPKRRKSNTVVNLPTVSGPVHRTTEKIPSLNTWHTGAVSSKQTQQYTGNKILGIGTLHKSNAVPIFTDQEAIDIAKMRR